MTKIVIHNGDNRLILKELLADSVQCVVTSPPYWGLRDYGVTGQIGLESSIEEYVVKMVEVFAEVRRVLRPDGTLWLNLGDTYAASRSYQVVDNKYKDVGNKIGHKVPAGLKQKDLCGIPWRVALALQADGWWLRSDIIWAKPNPMPESCTDRPTTAHEHIFLLTKSAKYFYDAEAVREDGPIYTRKAGGYQDKGGGLGEGTGGTDGRRGLGFKNKETVTNGRNLRSVWTIATAPFPEAHFATYPPELVRRCVAAGTSEKGCCPKCGAPWRRVVEKTGAVKNGNYENQKVNSTQYGGKTSSTLSAIPATSTTTGWTSTCKCLSDDFTGPPGSDTAEPLPFDPIPCTVLDIFGGSGTTGLVAAKMGRGAVLIELNPEYCEMAKRRINKDLGMWAEVENG